ncbi:MAG: hypothetical protein IJJ40_07300 [Clostridia bacterium]|nr:hypothetical protein [Clostridia bacterium]MBR3145395.1 hypothetical protein [Clostridia bacterium]
MQSIINQFYNEGFATLFFLRPVNFLKKRIKNKTAIFVLSFLIRIIYTAFVLYLAYNYLSYKLEFLFLQ